MSTQTSAPSAFQKEEDSQMEDESFSTVDSQSEEHTQKEEPFFCGPSKKVEKRKYVNPLLACEDENRILRFVNFPPQKYDEVVEQVTKYAKLVNFTNDENPSFKKVSIVTVEPERCRIRLSEDEKKEKEREARRRYASKPTTIEKRKILASDPVYKKKRQEIQQQPRVKKQKNTSQKARSFMLREIRNKDRRGYDAKMLQVKKLLEEQNKNK